MTSPLRRWTPFVALTLSLELPAQGNVNPRDTTMVNRSSNPLLTNFRFRSIGPASMGGRIDDIAVYEKDPRIIWIGYAVGGVFKSINAGTTFKPVFEQYGSASIGDIAVDQNNPDIAYIGTGEPNNRQTSSFGDGIYKTTDGGKTFTHIGLRETQTIARVVLDPRNSSVVYVAAPGALFGPNPDRGIYKTTDGGRDVDEGQVRRREHRLHRPGDRSVQPERAVRGELPAAPHGLLLQRWRSGQRALEDRRRGAHVDEAHRRRSAAGHVRTNRGRRRALESQRGVRAGRNRRRRLVRCAC